MFTFNRNSNESEYGKSAIGGWWHRLENRTMERRKKAAELGRKGFVRRWGSSTTSIAKHFHGCGEPFIDKIAVGEKKKLSTSRDDLIIADACFCDFGEMFLLQRQFVGLALKLVVGREMSLEISKWENFTLFNGASCSGNKRHLPDDDNHGVCKWMRENKSVIGIDWSREMEAKMRKKNLIESSIVARSRFERAWKSLSFVFNPNWLPIQSNSI